MCIRVLVSLHVVVGIRAQLALHYVLCNGAVAKVCFDSSSTPLSLFAMSKENKRPRNGDENQRASIIKLNVGGKDRRTILSVHFAHGELLI